MSITDRSAVSTDPIEQTVQFGRIAAALEYLYDHAADQPTLAQVSQAVHVSPEYLQRQFQQWAGGEPQENAAAYQPRAGEGGARWAAEHARCGLVERVQRHGAPARCVRHH